MRAHESRFHDHGRIRVGLKATSRSKSQKTYAVPVFYGRLDKRSAISGLALDPESSKLRVGVESA